MHKVAAVAVYLIEKYVWMTPPPPLLLLLLL
jgi:hypothetical protein